MRNTAGVTKITVNGDWSQADLSSNFPGLGEAPEKILIPPGRP
jgi:hypothetical protein